MSGSKVYLVMEPMRLVGEDLAQIIRELDPAARVHIVADMDEALVWVATQTSINRALLHCAPVVGMTSELGHALALRGAMNLYIGDRAERSTGHDLVLHRPFDNIAVATALSVLDDMDVEENWDMRRSA